MISERWKVPIAYGTVYLAWGSTYFAIRAGVNHFSPGALTGLRFLLAGTLMLAARAILGRKNSTPSREELVNAALLGLFLLGGGTGFLGYAEQTVPSGIAALVVGCSPMLFAVLNRAIGGKELTKYQIAGGILGTAGVVLLAATAESWNAGVVPLKGLGILIAGMCCWVTSSVVSKKMRLPADNSLTAGVEMLAAGALLLIAGRLHGEFRFSELSRMPRVSAIAIIYLATAGSCLGFTAYSWLLRREPANRISSYAFVNPVVAVFLGVTFAGEKMSWPVAAACAIVLSGVSLSLFGPHLGRKELPATEPEA